MKRIRIGNDVRIVWTLTRNGEAESLEGRDLRVRLVHDMSKASVPFEWACIGQAVVGTFQGKDQEKTGRYSLVVAENAGRADMHTLDHAGALMLVDRSWKADGEDEGGCSNVTVETVELADDLQFARDGRSAYELALLHGFEGTEEEYALEYVRAREAAERAAADASAAVEVSGRAAEQAGSALRLVDETVMRVYRDGGYNMDQCLWYGHWFGCVLGRPAGSAAGEMYDLDVVNSGSRVLFSALAEPVDCRALVRNVIGTEGGWAGTFGTYGVGDGHGRVEMFCERYYGNYPAAGEEVCRQRVKVPSGRYRLGMEVLGCCTRERDSWLAAPDVEGQAFSMRANGVEMAGCGGSRVLVATAVGDMGQVYSLVDSVEVTDGWLELVLYAGDARTANWFILRCVGLQQTDVAEEYMVVKQTCHSCLDVGRVFHRLVLTQDRNVFEAPTTLYGAWESVTAGLEARVRSLVADEATVEDVEALD